MKTKKIKVEITIKVQDDGSCHRSCQFIRKVGFGERTGEVMGCYFGAIDGSQRHPNCIKAEEEQNGD